MIKGIMVFIFATLLFTISSVHAAGVITLPQTGQKKCYDTAGKEIACAGTGQDGNIRAGVPWPSPRFAINGDCVTDNLTGLVWARDGNLPGSSKTWGDAIGYANGLTLCGHSDWRLPNVNELESLVNTDQANIAAWLKTQGFKNVRADAYWSSTTYARDAGTAQGVNMVDGNVGFTDKGYTGAYLWPVRADSMAPARIWKTGQTKSYRSGDDGDLKKGAAWPVPRFTINGECVTDNLTGLMWSRNADLPGAVQTWQDSLKYAKDLTLCGYSDWRLPNRKELISLVDWSKYTPALPAGHPFTDVQSASYWWSSTTWAFGTDSAWFLREVDGYVHGNFQKSWEFGNVWPVRAGIPLADLIETSVSTPPVSRILGGTFSVTDTVKNQGKGSALASTTRYYLSPTTSKTGASLLSGLRSVPSLSTGATSSGTTYAAIPPGIPSGIYYLLSCADDKKSIGEANERNNCKASATTIQILGPDLVETAVSDPPATGPSGSTFSITDTVKNQGNAAAGASTTRYYLSLTTTKGSTSIRLAGSRSVPAISPRSSFAGTVSVTIPPNAAVGIYYLLACADDARQIAEGNEINNCTPSATTVEVRL